MSAHLREPVRDDAFPPMATQMKVDMLFNKGGGVWIFHDRPLPDILKWIECDAEAGTVTMVMASGKVQELGMKLQGSQGAYLSAACEARVMLAANGQVTDLAIVPVITRGVAA